MLQPWTVSERKALKHTGRCCHHFFRCSIIFDHSFPRLMITCGCGDSCVIIMKRDKKVHDALIDSGK